MIKGFEPGRGLYIYGCLQPFARSHFLRCPAGAVWKWVDEIAAPAGGCSACGRLSCGAVIPRSTETEPNSTETANGIPNFRIPLAVSRVWTPCSCGRLEYFILFTWSCCLSPEGGRQWVALYSKTYPQCFAPAGLAERKTLDTEKSSWPRADRGWPPVTAGKTGKTAVPAGDRGLHNESL